MIPLVALGISLAGGAIANAVTKQKAQQAIKPPSQPPAQAPAGVIAATYKYKDFVGGDAALGGWYYKPRGNDIDSQVWNVIQYQIIRMLNSNDWKQWRQDTFNGNGDWSQDLNAAMFTTYQWSIHNAAKTKEGQAWGAKYMTGDLKQYNDHPDNYNDYQHAFLADLQQYFDYHTFSYPNIESIVNPNQQHGINWNTVIKIGTQVVKIAAVAA